MNSDPAPKGLTTLQQLAKDAHLSYRTVHRYAKLGRIKTVRLGNSVRVTLSERMRILEKGF